jgi:outer membrane receptor protein involved in Fe transport
VIKAHIEALDEATGVSVSTDTTGAGDYTLPYLTPDHYTLSATAPGFKTEIKSDIELQAAQVAVIDFRLAVGSVSQSITVNNDESLLDRGDATRGEEVENTRVTELPLNGRNPVMLDRLNSSVIWNGNLIWQRPFDGQVWTNLDINGSGNYNTEIMLDGQPDQTPRPQNGGHTNGGYVAPDDAVQDFKIVTNPYNAEYGQTRGGAIDMDLKSGTNKIHGDVYEYLRRTWLDANWWVNDAEKALNPTKAYLYATPQHKLDQFGAELDGPVVLPKVFNGRNKLFFVAQVENWNEVEPAYADTSVPCTANTCGDWADGDFSGLTYNGAPVTIYNPYSTYNCTVNSKPETCRNPFPDNQIPPDMINSTAQALLKLYPAPNQPGTTGTPWQQNYYAQEPTVDKYRNALIKLDWSPTQKDRYTLRYGYWERYETDISNGIVNGPAGYGEDPLGDRTHTFAAQWVHTFRPNLLMNLMADVDVKAEIADVAPTGFNLSAIWPSSLVSEMGGLSMMPGFEPSSFTNLSGGTGNGLTTTDGLNLFPSITWIKGKHSIHAGLDWRLGQYAIVTNASTIASLDFSQQWTQNCWSCGSGSDYTGNENTEGNSIASMLLGLGSGGSDGIGSTAFYSNKYFAPYVQDDWKLTPKLTLNLGVRYDLQPYYVERHNRADYAFNTTTLNPVDATLPFTTLATGAAVHDLGGVTFLGVDGNPRRVYSTNLTEVQPRIGFAFSPRNDLVIRGGFGEVFQQTDAFPSLAGFSSSTSYVNSPNGGLTPINFNTGSDCCFGGNLSDPFPSITQPSGSSLGFRSAI